MIDLDVPLKVLARADCADERSRTAHLTGFDDGGYGTGGLGDSRAWCSTEGGYVLGFVTGRIADHDRMTRIDNAVRGCLGLPPL